VEILESLYLAPAERLLEELRLVAETVRSVLLIGHNPGLHDLAAVLLGPKGLDSDSPAVNHLIEGYPTGALAEFSVAGTWRDLDTGGGRLLHFIRPRDLAGDLTGADA
jgi:phosphohistidine phosphatase